MSSTRVRIQVVVLAFILLPAAAGVLAVNASATCERFVRTYVTKPVRNTVSKQTAEAWAEWRLAHPNWRPNPKLQRPKYVMTRDEAVQKVNFACSIDTDPTNLDILFKEADVDVPPPVVTLPAMTTEIKFPDQIPPEVAELTVPPLPSIPQVNVVTPTGVPEPASLLLAGTGIGFLWLLAGTKFRRVQN